MASQESSFKNGFYAVLRKLIGKEKGEIWYAFISWD
jgi:hypothetical protein